MVLGWKRITRRCLVKIGRCHYTLRHNILRYLDQTQFSCHQVSLLKVGLLVVALLCSKNGLAALDSPTYKPTDANPHAAASSQQEAAQQFRQAVIFFKDKLYAQAIESFLNAGQLGMDIAKLYFNLGSAYYKTQQYDAALAAFTKASKDRKFEVLARINMALSLLKLSKSQQATQQLRLAASRTDNAKYLLLIQNIAAKNQLPVFSMNRSSGWQNAFSIYVGINDNVRLQNDDALNPDNKPQEDSFLQTALSASYRTSSVFRVLFNLQTNNYSSVKEYNYMQINIEPELRDQLGKWQYALTASYQPSMLDGSAYLTTSGIRGEIRYKLNHQYIVGGTVAQLSYNDDRNSAKHLAGDAFAQKLFVEYQGRRLSLSVSGLAQDEDRADFYTDGVPRQSYSPQRTALLVEARFSLNANNFIDLNLQTRRSEYPAMDAVVIERTDQRDIISLRYAHRINQSYWVIGTANRVDNDSSINEYTSNSYLIGLSGTF